MVTFQVGLNISRSLTLLSAGMGILALSGGIYSIINTPTSASPFKLLTLTITLLNVGCSGEKM
jgi:hypothetical protein